jgi:hypothetical protein
MRVLGPSVSAPPDLSRLTPEERDDFLPWQSEQGRLRTDEEHAAWLDRVGERLE